MRRLAAIAAVALASTAWGAEGAPAVQRAPLDVHLNGSPVGEAVVLLEGEDAWLPIEDLHGYGVLSFDGTRRRAGGKEWVSLRSLAPALLFAVSERDLRLDLTVGPALLGTARIDLGNRAPPGTVWGGDLGGFVNYAVQADLRRQFSGYGEAGISNGPALLWSGFSIPPGALPVRGITSFTYDLLSRLERLTVGDAVVGGGGLGSSGVVGGISWARDFALDPYLVQAPRPAFTAFAATPSTLEVWVNGALVRQQVVPPGTLDLANIPLVSGSSDVRTVLRDSYGREQSFNLRATFTPGLLAPGLSDFGYTLGFLRQRMDAASFDYGRPVLLARHRAAVDDLLTLGGRLEASLDRVMAGPSVTVGTLLGQVDLEVVGSVAQGMPGAAAGLGWAWFGRRASAGARLRAATQAFATPVLDPWADRPTASASLFGTVQVLEPLGLGVDLAAVRLRDAGNVSSATLRGDLSLGANFTLLASLTQTFGGPAAGPSGMVTLVWSVGERTTAQASAGGGSTGGLASAGIARTLPPGPGYAYRVEAQAGSGDPRAAGVFTYQTGFGRYEAQVDQMGPTTTAAVRAAGGVVFAGGRVFATRPVEEAYALVRVGVPDVTAYLENQEVGTTDSSGDLLVPSLLARYSNRLSIRAADIPLDYDVGPVEQRVAPPRKGGMVVAFDVNPVRAVAGRLRLDAEGGGTPGGGELALVQSGVTLRSPTTDDGRFFLEGLRPGAHEAEVTWRGGTCRVTLVAPPRAGLQDLGELDCDPSVRVAAAR